MSLWAAIPITTRLECRALAIWRAREMTYPEFIRRMTPDRFDQISGAWDRVLAEAEKENRNGRA